MKDSNAMQKMGNIHVLKHNECTLYHAWEFNSFE